MFDKLPIELHFERNYLPLLVQIDHVVIRGPVSVLSDRIATILSDREFVDKRQRTIPQLADAIMNSLPCKTNHGSYCPTQRGGHKRLQVF